MQAIKYSIVTAFVVSFIASIALVLTTFGSVGSWTYVITFVIALICFGLSELRPNHLSLPRRYKINVVLTLALIGLAVLTFGLTIQAIAGAKPWPTFWGATFVGSLVLGFILIVYERHSARRPITRH